MAEGEIMRKNPICNECGRWVAWEYAVPATWYGKRVYLHRKCAYIGVPELTPRLNPREGQLRKAMLGKPARGRHRIPPSELGPLRKVIKRWGRYELLECGHWILPPETFTGIQLAKRRRCHECLAPLPIFKKWGDKPVPFKNPLVPLVCKFCGAKFYGPYWGELQVCPKCGRRQVPRKNPKRPAKSPHLEKLIKQEEEEKIAYWTQRILEAPYITDRERVLYELVKQAQADKNSVEIVRKVVKRLYLLPELEQVQKKIARERGRKRNPTNLYQSFHGNPPARLRKVNLPIPKKGTRLIKIGRLTAIEYKPEHPSRLAGREFRHTLGDTGYAKLPEKPLLVTDEKGENLYIIKDGAKTKFTHRGIIA